jgi:hypothetical protein
MSSLKKICIIIPYFGKWPAWINYFLLSCKYNKPIDWFFFTDCESPVIKDNNLFFFNMSLKDFNQTASSKLGISINVKYPYKLCDLKPAYGEIFSEYISNYDYWGYGDLDLVYGNIRQFLTEEILASYDIISNHHDFVTGHFCILKNTQEINQLFKKGGFFKKAFQQPDYTGFDEQILTYKISPHPNYIGLTKKINIIYHLALNSFVKSPLKKIFKLFKKSVGRSDKESLKDFTSIIKYESLKKVINVHFNKTFQSDLMLKKEKIKNWKIEWRNGVLKNLHQNKELLYFHFPLSKTRKSFKIDGYEDNIIAFSISKSGIQNSRQ